MSSRGPAIEAMRDENANIAWRLGVRDPAAPDVRRAGAVSSYAGTEKV